MMKLAKRFVIGFVIAFVLCVAVPGVLPWGGEMQTADAAVRISKKYCRLAQGKTLQLKIKGTKKKVKWKSSRKSVATVSRKGKVKARKPGTAKITGIIKGKKYTCKVTVYKTVNIPKISKTSALLYRDDSMKLKVSGTNKFVMWNSSNSSVASVGGSGNVKAKKEGTATITATIGAGSNSVKLQCQVTVKNNLSSDPSSVLCYMGEYQEVTILVRGSRSAGSPYFLDPQSRIVKASWNDQSPFNTLVIMPKKVGRTTITVFYDLDSNEKLEIPVTVLPRRSEWITENELRDLDIWVKDNHGIIGLYFRKINEGLYLDEIVHFELICQLGNYPENPVIGTEYYVNGIHYQFTNSGMMFKVEDLRRVGIL